MFKRIMVLVPLLSFVCVLASCSGCSTSSQPSIIVRATLTNGTTNLCVKGTGFTPNGPLRLSVSMPQYTFNGAPGQNPNVGAPYGDTTALQDSSFRLNTNVTPVGTACYIGQNQTQLTEPVLLVFDKTKFQGGSVALPPGFMCATQQTLSPPSPPTPVPPPPPFGDPAACQ